MNIEDKNLVAQQYIPVPINYPPGTRVQNSNLPPVQSQPTTPLTRPNANTILGRGGINGSNFFRFIKLANPAINDAYLAQVINAYINYAPLLGINSDAALSQAILETGSFSFKGDVKPYQNNFAGIGATGGGNPGESFSSIEHGAIAHMLHLRAYCGFWPPAGYEPSMAQRTRFILGAGLSTIKNPRAPNRLIPDLSGKWATDPNYAKKIRDVMNSVIRS